MTINLSGVVLPQPKLPFKIPHKELSTDNVTLDGTWYVDFTAQRREWLMEWERLTAAEYNQIRSIYDLQFTGFTFGFLVITELAINTNVRIFLNDKDIIYDGDCVRNVKMRLVERDAVL